MGKRLDRSLANTYLAFYNGIQLAGWSWLFIQTISHYLTHGTYVGLYDKTVLTLQIFQTGAIFEIIHAILGIVPSNFMITAIQVYSRVLVVWGVLWAVPQVQDTYALPITYFAWNVTEIIRYSYYTFNILLYVPSILTWCRYSFFLALYPIGITGELLLMYFALPEIWDKGIFSLSMPNPVNWSFSYYLYLIVIMFSYIPTFPQLYGHMLKQRKKVLGGTAEKKTR